MAFELCILMAKCNYGFNIISLENPYCGIYVWANSKVKEV